MLNGDDVLQIERGSRAVANADQRGEDDLRPNARSIGAGRAADTEVPCSICSIVGTGFPAG
jgi:hypothetical protein